jgi:AraC-like DNA-binding protein
MLFIVGASFYFIVFCFVPNRIFTQQWILLVILSYTTERVLFRPDPWSKIRQDVLPDAKELDDGEPESTEVNSAHIEVIDKWIKRKKPFLHPEFQLMDLRQVLPMNRTYLSQLINNAYGCSFYQWVNALRVKEAKQLMTTKPDLKMQDIANKCGFSSRQALHRAFLRETGITPREFLAQPNNQ